MDVSPKLTRVLRALVKSSSSSSPHSGVGEGGAGQENHLSSKGKKEDEK